jgi:hypothetical protein
MRFKVKLRSRVTDLKDHALEKIRQDEQPQNKHRDAENLIAFLEYQHPADGSQQTEKR